jgi:hypothetical protein
VRERGVQSRRVNAGKVETVRRPGPPSGGGGNFWQVLAIVALIAATAGWTTVGVIALRAPATAALESPIDSFDPNASDPSVAPVADTHDAPELEALLPTAINGTTLEIQSWTGSGILTDDAWSTSVTAFLTTKGKTPADLRVAQGYDPNQVLDGSVGVYRAAGVAATDLRDALVAAWKGDYPDMTVTEVTLGGKQITKGGFGADTASSFLYVRDDVVFDIESTDEAIATAALAALPLGGASGAPASGAPAGSAGPSPS